MVGLGGNNEANQSIKVLSTSIVEGGLPLSIVFPASAEGKFANFEIKGGLLHRIPTFHGLSMEDPNKHLKEFPFVVGSMTPPEADEHIFKLKTFPFSLANRAKDWLYELPEGHVTSWDAMMRAFLEKFFPASRVIAMRKKITGIQQAEDELYPAYYESQMLDAASGGTFVDKTPAQGKELIANRAGNAQQYEGIWTTTRQVKEVTMNLDLSARLDKLTSLMSQVLTPKVQGVAQVCGVCSTQGHMTDQCPQLIENGGWESWRDHPNFRWRDNDNVQNANKNTYNRGPHGAFYQRPQAPPQAQGTSPNYDKIIETLNSSTQALIQGQQNHGKDIADLKKQMGQVVDFMTKFHEQGKLPSNTIPNPKGGFEGTSS
ncbi:uncharacterized protein LOC112184289 [Rosa chinensis]|uniref:uncharacterized protein LOC112184289 n=1 Tax=Rosa chinensis TaxID=74649 RepID=UPI000D094F7E|nr:uncharacterized protein LOC112184289 [Rosa chinensis]